MSSSLNASGALDMLKVRPVHLRSCPSSSATRSQSSSRKSDRYLPELFYPDMTNFYRQPPTPRRLLAEGHARIAAPLLDIAMALIAIYAVLGGDFRPARVIRRASVAATAARTGAAPAGRFGARSPPATTIQNSTWPAIYPARSAAMDHRFDPAFHEAGAGQAHLKERARDDRRARPCRGGAA